MKTLSQQDYKWQGSGTLLPSGSRIFEAHGWHPDGLVWGIADDTALYPHATDDGVLWLNHNKCLRVSDGMCFIPVIDNAGNERVVGCGAATILYLSRMLRWTIENEVHGAYYNASDMARSSPDPVMELLKQALGSGQLRDTIIGKEIESFFAANDINWKD